MSVPYVKGSKYRAPLPLTAGICRHNAKAMAAPPEIKVKVRKRRVVFRSLFSFSGLCPKTAMQISTASVSLTIAPVRPETGMKMVRLPIPEIMPPRNIRSHRCDCLVYCPANLAVRNSSSTPVRKFSKKRYSRYITTFPTSLFYNTGCRVRNLSKTGSRAEIFFRGLSGAGPRDGLLFHRTQKTPEGVFYRMFLDVISVDASRQEGAWLERKAFCRRARSFISCIICAVKSHILAFLRCFPEHFYAPMVSPVTRR